MGEDKRILIVDDCRGDASITQKCAAKHGYVSEILCNHGNPHGTVNRLIDRLGDSDIPGIIVLDGLKGECYIAVKEIQKAKPEARYLIYTSSKEEIVEGMPTGMNVRVFQRGDKRIYDHICQP